MTETTFSRRMIKAAFEALLVLYAIACVAFAQWGMKHGIVFTG
jgi:hypothetical protein